MRLLSILILALAFVSSPAEARKHRHYHTTTPAYSYAHPQCNIIFPCEGVQRNARGDAFADKAKFGMGRPRYYKIKPLSSTVERAPYKRRVVGSSPTGATMLRRAVTVVEGEMSARPSDCYGIAWCGCWLRHQVGKIADRTLNLAVNWRNVGSPTSPHVGAIVVWRHHVGILKSEPVGGYAMVYSGNNGSGNQATVRRAYVGNAIAYRSL